MAKSKKRKRNRRRPAQHKGIPTITVTPITGPFEPLDVVFYKPGHCALCECRADDLMIGTTWLGQCRRQHFACYFCPLCVLFRMSLMTIEQKSEFYQNAELDMACELAQEALVESGITL